MGNSSGIGGGYNTTGVADTFQDNEHFVIKVAEGSPTEQTATATNASDAVLIDNCSPCPIKATITLKDTAKGSGGKDKEVCTYLKPGQFKVFDYTQDAVLAVKTEEADPASAPMDAVTACADITAMAAASQDLEIHINFFNQ